MWGSYFVVIIYGNGGISGFGVNIFPLFSKEGRFSKNPNFVKKYFFVLYFLFIYDIIEKVVISFIIYYCNKWWDNFQYTNDIAASFFMFSYC